MKWTSNKIRQTWLDFWKSKKHFIVPSKNLIPINDDSLIWINSGVATLKKYFSGIETPPAKRLTNCQKAVRTNDIENVGITSRHHTFFEMLGNFSIGDYFKLDAINWAYELLTKVFKFNKDKLYFTVYEKDDDAYAQWIKCGISSDHIIKCNKNRNFWDVGSGPCGPCTEIYYDRGIKFDPEKKGIKLFYYDIENDRYVEIWNIVFSQFNNNGNNEYSELIHKNIDTGCGLERLACILQNAITDYDIDIFNNVINEINKQTKLNYHSMINLTNKQKLINKAFRIIADHLKTCIFCIADGAIPSNKDRGYIIRKLVRRAIIYGQKIQINNLNISPIIQAIIDAMSKYYPYLIDNKNKIVSILKKEQNQFNQTLKNGFKLFEQCAKNNFISGEDAFKLLDTYGFPIEITIELAQERKINIDLNKFKQLQVKHSEISNTKFIEKVMDVQNNYLMDFTKKSIFDYDANECDCKVIGIFNEKFQSIELIKEDGVYWLVFDKTIIYAQCGGEVADKAYIIINNKKIDVLDTIKGPNGQHFHKVAISYLNIKIGDDVHINLDVKLKKIISATHTAEHLIQSTLQKIIDKNIKQMGASKTHEKLTFDFQYHKKISDEQLKQIEDLINNYILNDYKVDILYMTLDEAIKIGALAFFTNVYKKIHGKLRVIKINNISTEICAGRHVKRLGEIEKFHIIKYLSKGSGAWRLEAIVTNYNIIKYTTFLNNNLIIKKNKLLMMIKEAKFSNNELIKKINMIKSTNDLNITSMFLKQIDQLEAQVKKEISLFRKKNNDLLISETMKTVNINTNKINLIETKQFDHSTLISLAQNITKNYIDALFVILNISNPISYIIIKGKKSSYKLNSKDLMNKINNTTNGKGGGNDNYCQGSCENNQLNLKLIKKLIQELNS